MLEFVTLEQAAAHLRLDTGGDDDADLQLKIQAASSAVANYLKKASPYEPEVDSSGDIILDSAGDPVPIIDSAGDFVVLPEIKAATLIMIGYLYKNRDENADGAFDRGYLPMPVTALLYPLRKPTAI